MKTFATTVTCLTLCLFPAFQADAAPQVGEPAPELSIGTLIQAPDGAVATLEALQGKAVVLEFWATWCAPCVAAIPHLNKLAEAFESEPVVFLSITNENDPELIRRFLENRPMKSWVGIDAGEATFSAYDITGIPTTVLIDKTGTVAGITHPTHVSEFTIESLLAGKPLGLPSAQNDETASAGPGSRTHPGDIRPGLELPDDEPPLFRIELRPAYYTDISISGAINQNATMLGMSLEHLLTQVYGVSPAGYEIAFEVDYPAAKYDLIVHLPPSFYPEAGQELMRTALESGFGFQPRRETRETDVYVLTAPNGPTEGFKESEIDSIPYASMQSGCGTPTREVVSMPVDLLVNMLEQSLGVPVLDETGLTGRYDYALEWTSNRPEGIVDAVNGHLGLALARERRPIEITVFEAKR